MIIITIIAILLILIKSKMTVLNVLIVNGNLQLIESKSMKLLVKRHPKREKFLIPQGREII